MGLEKEVSIEVTMKQGRKLIRAKGIEFKIVSRSKQIMTERKYQGRKDRIEEGNEVRKKAYVWKN